jgi:parallel beta-helix repeat protein
MVRDITGIKFIKMKYKYLIAFLFFTSFVFAQRSKMKYFDITDTLKFGAKTATGIYITGGSADSTKLLHAGIINSLGRDTAYFYPETYGAVVNDTLDDRSAIQAAIDAACNKGGGIVWLAKGEYRLKSSASRGSYQSSLHVCSNVTLMGQGFQCVLKTTLTTSGTHVISLQHAGNNIKLKDFQIKSDSSYATAGIIALYGVNNLLISRIKIDRGTCWGIELYDCSKVLVENCDIQNGGACHGIEVGNSNGVVVRNNEFYSNTTKTYHPLRGNGIEFFTDDTRETRSYGNLVEGNHIHNIGGGITMWGDSLTSIIGNTIHQISGHGMTVVTWKGSVDTILNVGIKIVGNTIKGTGYINNSSLGMIIEPTNRDILIANNILDTIISLDAGYGGGVGIDNQADGTIIEGNIIQHAYINGISNQADYCVINNNRIMDCSVLTDNAYRGISCSGDYCTIVGNSVRDTRADSRMDICIYVPGTNCVIVANITQGASNVNIYDPDGTDIKEHNKE